MRKTLWVLASCFIGATAFAADQPAATTDASSFPNKPVWLVTGAAGSSPDILARILAQKLGEIWKQSVLVDNRPGALGTVGYRFVANSAPDGYTLFVDTAASPISSLVYSSAGKPEKPLKAVSLIAHSPLVLVSNPQLGPGKDVLKQLKAAGKSVYYATPGSGSLQHLTMERLRERLGIAMENVPYRGGGDAVRSVIAGETQIAFLGAAPALPQIASGRVTPVAVSTKERFGPLPNVPTMAELGYADLSGDNWHGVMAPQDTPPSVMTKLNAAINEALRDPQVQHRFLEAGAVTAGSTIQAFQAQYDSDLKMWAPIVKSLNLKAN